MSELLPCPFCGGEAETLTAESMHGGYMFGIMCNDCRSRGDVYDTEAEAIAAWNSRAERTCKLDYERHCSNCGVYVHTSAVLVRKDLDGGAWTVVSKPVNYCPNCGRKVVSE